MTLDAREGFSKSWIGKPLDRLGIEIELRSCSFPNRPGARGCDANLVVVAGESTIVSAHHVVAFIFRDDLDEFFPDIGKDPTTTFLIEPLDLFRPAEKDAAQHQLRCAIRMSLGALTTDEGIDRVAQLFPALIAKARRLSGVMN